MKDAENQIVANLLEIQEKVAGNAMLQQENKKNIVQLQRDHIRDIRNINERVSQGEREHDRDMREIRKTLKEIYEIRKESDLRAAQRAEEFKREMAE